jgi:general secretion pathway protein I
MFGIRPFLISRARSSTLRTARGFTLLEIMVALAILATGIATVLEAFGSSLRLGSKASQKTQAVIYAQNVMERALAKERLEDGEDSGEFPGGYHWRARIQEVRPPEEDPKRMQSNAQQATDFFHLKEIEVVVLWSEGLGRQSSELRSLRTQTEQSQPQAP